MSQAKTLTKRVLFYSYRPREGSIHLHATAVSRALSTTNQRFFISRLLYNLSAVIHQKGPYSASKPR